VAAEQRTINATSIAVRPSQPLIGIVLIEDGQEIKRYFTDEADAVVATRTATDAWDLAGAWSDLDWEETVTKLERIRHESVPTPSIDDLLATRASLPPRADVGASLPVLSGGLCTKRRCRKRSHSTASSGRILPRRMT